MSRLRLREIEATGSLEITGSFGVKGQSTFTQLEPSASAVVVAGAMEIVQSQLQSELQKAKITIQNLGTLGDRDLDETIDLGGFF